MFLMSCSQLLFCPGICLEFVADPPDRRYFPSLVVMDLLADPLDVHVHRPRITDVIIAPDLVEELFSCEDAVGIGREAVEKFQLLGGMSICPPM